MPTAYDGETPRREKVMPEMRERVKDIQG